jgi:hypothetical protein
MQWIVLTGVGDLDGRYEFDLDGREFTTREWGWLKRLSGYLPLTIGEAFDGGDPELFACFAVIALHRSGKVLARDVPDAFERIIDTPSLAAIRIESDQAEEEDEERPPPSSLNESDSISGNASATSSATSVLPLSRTGIPALASSPSPPPGSGS